MVRQPDMIFLYRQPILLEWIETGEDLHRLVRSVLIHETAHHFGFSDADIEGAGAGGWVKSLNRAELKTDRLNRLDR